MKADQILKELEPLGTESYRKILRNHGVPEPLFGVKIEDMKRGPEAGQKGLSTGIRKVKERGAIGKKRKTVKC